MRITIIIVILTIQVSCKKGNETNIKSENSTITELTKCNCNNEAITKYHILTNKAEIAICDGDFDRASKNYSLAFREIKKPFGHDVYNAALSNQLSKNLKNVLDSLTEKIQSFEKNTVDTDEIIELIESYKKKISQEEE